MVTTTRRPFLLRSLAGVRHNYQHCAVYGCNERPSHVETTGGNSYGLCRQDARRAISRERENRWDGRYRVVAL